MLAAATDSGRMSAYVLIISLLQLDASFGGGGSSSGGGGGGGGGGSSSGSGDGGSMPWWMWVIVLLGTMVVLGLGQRRMRAMRAAELAREVTLWEQLEQAAPGWNETATEQYVTRALIELNEAWSRRDLSPMQEWLTPRMLDRMQSMVEALELLGRHNTVSTIKVQELLLDDVSAVGATPGFTIHVRATCVDALIDDSTGQQLGRSAYGIDERWRFVTGGEQWLLDEIIQPTMSEEHVVSAIEEFATGAGLHYSADMGRLLLPSRGVLFAQGSFEKADVNNHVIGHLENGTLVQLYTYEPDPDGDAGDDLVVAQSVLEREVGDILVRRRKRGRWKTKGLKELRLESNAFERAWQVHATEQDDIAAFELLNPAYLDRLASLDYPIGIEAVGRSLYLFDESGKVPYEVMFDLLRAAHAELRR